MADVVPLRQKNPPEISGPKLPPNVNQKRAEEAARLLLGQFRDVNAHDKEIFLRAVIVVFMGYPEAVISAVVHPRTGLAARLKWCPSSTAEIVEACEAVMEPIYQRAKVEHETRLRLAAPPEAKMTPEEMEAQKRRVDGLLKRTVEHLKAGLNPRDVDRKQRREAQETLARYRAEASAPPAAPSVFELDPDNWDA